VNARDYLSSLSLAVVQRHVTAQGAVADWHRRTRAVKRRIANKSSPSPTISHLRPVEKKCRMSIRRAAAEARSRDDQSDDVFRSNDVISDPAERSVQSEGKRCRN
jgi:hypothetical protein